MTIGAEWDEDISAEDAAESEDAESEDAEPEAPSRTIRRRFPAGLTLHQTLMVLPRGTDDDRRDSGRRRGEFDDGGRGIRSEPEVSAQGADPSEVAADEHRAEETELTRSVPRPGPGRSRRRAFEPLPDLPLSMMLEALLLVADEPVSDMLLAELHRLAADRGAGRAAPDWRRTTPSRGGASSSVRWPAVGACTPGRSVLGLVERFVLRGQTARVTQAALETLAVVAYRQPVTRGRVAAVRGVNVDGVMRTLLSRGLVAERGSDPESSATLYGTTRAVPRASGPAELGGIAFTSSTPT